MVSAITVSCAPDTSHVINVAPSANGELEAIAEAADRLNELCGAEVYSVRAVDSGRIRDGEVVVRAGDPPGSLVAATERTRKGIVITLTPGLGALEVAHELGHAAGLGHVRAEGNLMFAHGWGIGWELTSGQMEEMR